MERGCGLFENAPSSYKFDLPLRMPIACREIYTIYIYWNYLKLKTIVCLSILLLIEGYIGSESGCTEQNTRFGPTNIPEWLRQIPLRTMIGVLTDRWNGILNLRGWGFLFLFTCSWLYLRLTETGGLNRWGHLKGGMKILWHLTAVHGGAEERRRGWRVAATSRAD